MSKPFAGLVPGYRTIVADPPWPYRDAGKESSTLVKTVKLSGEVAKGVAIEDYPVISIGSLCNLPVQDLAARNSHLYLWTTNAFMDEAHDVARAWGFTPKTIITWVKVKADKTPSMKTGYYFRGATEHALFCVRGILRPRTNKAIPTAFLHPRIHQHSTKPDAFYKDVVRPISYPRGLEMFARRPRKGWDVWGNEV